MKFLRVLASVVLVMCSLTSLADVACPEPATVRQPDGTLLTIVLHGDEFCNYTTTADGYTVVLCTDGYYRYARLDGGNLVSTGITAHNAGSRSAAERSWTATAQRNIAPAMSASANDIKNAQRAMRRKLHGVSGNINYSKFRGLVILVEYNDCQFIREDAHDAWNDILNKHDYNGYTDTYTNNFVNYTGSVRDYFYDNSNHIFDPVFDVYGPVKVNYSQYYVNQHENAQTLMSAALSAADPQINFRDYDQNGDGVVDMVFFIVAGGGSNYSSINDSRLLWPHASSISKSVDGIRTGRYACSTELQGSPADRNLAGIGTICHEFSHVLGLADLYDTDYETGGQSIHPGKWDLMAGGSYLNSSRTPSGYSVYQRYALGFSTPTKASTGTNTLIAGDDGLRINSRVANEFFLLENRQQQSKWDAYLPGHGMLVWRVDSTNTDVWENNRPNAVPDHLYCELLRAGGADPNSAALASDPFPGSKGIHSLTNTTTPSLLSWTGVPTPMVVNDINENNGVITFGLGYEDNQPGPENITGEYVSATVDSHGCNTSNHLTVTTDGSRYKVKGIYGDDYNAVNATYDPSVGQLSIAANQVILDDDGEGHEIHLVLLETANKVAPDDDIVLHFDQNGNASLINGLGLAAIFYQDGVKYIHKSLYSNGYRMFKANGTITSYRVNKDDNGNIVPRDTTQFATAFVLNADKKSGAVYGIDGYGWQSFTIDDNDNVTFKQDNIFYYNSSYGAGYIANGTQWGFVLTKGLTGTINKEGGTITTDPWFIYLTGNGGAIYNGNKEKSIITFPANLFPAEVIPDSENPASSVVGTYVSGTVDNQGCNSSNVLKISVGDSDGAVKVSGFMNGTEQIDATYDATNGHLTIPGGQVVMTDSEGNETRLALMKTTSTYNATKDIIFIVEADGHGYLANGNGLGYYTNSGLVRVDSKAFDLYRANGTIKTYEVTEDWSAVADSTEYTTATVFNDKGGIVYGIEGKTWLPFTKDSYDNVQFSLDDIAFYSNSYTNAKIYQGTGDGHFYNDRGMGGVLDMDAGTISLNPWMIVLINKSSSSPTRWGKNKSSSIITFPGNKPTVRGDADGDGEVDIADINFIINIILGYTAPTRESDVDGDGVVDIADINAAVAIIVGV